MPFAPHISDPPSFDCESYAYAEPGTENFTINCQVKGNPEVHVDSIFWIVGESNGPNITVNDTHKGFTIDITVSRVRYLTLTNKLSL